MNRRRGNTVHWFVVHQDGQPQLATASMSRSGAIKYWLKLADETWPYWYRRGMRAQRVRISWAPASKDGTGGAT
jgi:hypothetical protein